MDILSSCNLVNYFGKASLGGDGVGQIRIHPILLTKKATKLALYGLGNIRDERLNRMFTVPRLTEPNPSAVTGRAADVAPPVCVCAEPPRGAVGASGRARKLRHL